MYIGIYVLGLNNIEIMRSNYCRKDITNIYNIHIAISTPTFKTKALRLASIEGQVKCLLLLY